MVLNEEINAVFILAILYLIGNIIGSFASGWISAAYGRKSTLLWSGLPLALSWLAMGMAADLTIIYVTSFTHGLFAAAPWTASGRNMECNMMDTWITLKFGLISSHISILLDTSRLDLSFLD